MIVLGIDPGSVRIGFGVIKKENGRLTHIKSGLLRVGTDEKKSLPLMEADFVSLVLEMKPDIIGIEKLFFVKNRKTALGVAEARGVILNASVKLGVGVVEVAPSEVKLAVTGNGGASKAAVAKMVGFFIKIPAGKIIDDVTDALAVAIAASRKNLF